MALLVIINKSMSRCYSIEYYQNNSDYTVEYYDDNQCQFTCHYSNGSVCEKVNFIDGERNGENVLYTESGQVLMLRVFDSGLLEGKCSTFYASKTQGRDDDEFIVKSTCNYESGKKDGYEIDYYKTGEKKRETFYQNGIKIGKTKYYKKSPRKI